MLIAKGSLTLFALQGHPGLQVVHLQLETLQGAVSIPGLALVGDEDDDDDDEEQGAAGRDADDGGQGQEAVGHDAHRARGEDDPPNTHLQGTARVSSSLGGVPVPHGGRAGSAEPPLLRNRKPQLPSDTEGLLV